MPDEAKQGDHGWVEQNPESVYLPEEVFVAERDAITKRRPNLKATKNNDGVDCLHTTGLALSGGGIRSASFGLGALQAVQATFENKIIHGIEEIDYLSTVSGGGYIGCAMTAAMQNTGENFHSRSWIITPTPIPFAI